MMIIFYPIKIEEIEILKKKNPLNYELIKEEILLTGPNIRKLDGVTFIFKEKEKIIELLFSKKSLLLILLIIEYEIKDKSLEIENIYINNKEINDETFKKIVEFIKNDDEEYKISIFLKTEIDIDYEMGCIFYKEFYKGDEKHKNMLLDKWNI